MISITPFFHVYHKYVFIMSNINKIRLSGTTYSIQDLNATKTVELTQAQYDELPTTAKTSNSLFVITDAEAGDLSNYYTKSETSGATEISTALNAKADTATTYTKTETDGLLDTKLDVTAYTPTDLSNYYTKSETSGATEISTALASKADTATTYTKTETDNAITAATSTKQDTLVSGTNIKTINNQSILGEGNIEIQGGGGGGKAISAGTNISITTGETADTINCTLPITATSSPFNTISVGVNSRGGEYNTLIGPNAKCDYSSRHNVFLIAQSSTNSSQGSYVKGSENVIIGSMKNGEMNWDIPSFSTSKSVVIGGGQMYTDKDNSLAIGYNANVSGTTKTNINNQLTIDTSNQVYIYNKDNTEMICLQDQLGGGGSITIDPSLDSGSTNPVANSAITTAINDRATKSQAVGGYQFGMTNDVLNITLESVSKGNIGNDIYYPSINGKGIFTNNLTWAQNNYNFQLVETSAITTSVTSASTDAQVPSAKAVYDQLGGLKLVKLTQSEYDSLTTKDSQTLYVVTNS